MAQGVQADQELLGLLYSLQEKADRAERLQLENERLRAENAKLRNAAQAGMNQNDQSGQNNQNNERIGTQPASPSRLERCLRKIQRLLELNDAYRELIRRQNQIIRGLVDPADYASAIQAASARIAEIRK